MRRTIAAVGLVGAWTWALRSGGADPGNGADPEKVAVTHTGSEEPTELRSHGHRPNGGNGNGVENGNAGGNDGSGENVRAGGGGNGGENGNGGRQR